ncbi:O-acetylhomoserine aminocarboxypropyltransferase/cysteine synthase family protein [Halarcobacter ebronensis]|uniref:O-acetylhomoserine aminocarboxypropyltransferase n=1 Tax=Halarcobacter ebronensis TaxID=1462615 RepID=A0A4Q1AJN2_9BACT|nr:O-acetylhomoserine aminocarboxypropyltransferase/cysteine synthase family protein [Halarcobacter ebronensis]QKF81742.1 O-acetylhomoserine sulfhydrylase [Halarcobacter ebronensis]RXK04580.1 O-acetylhomoserine aminocarboxypropyltransferase [Halarcobacter ebronensis]
MQPNTLAIHAGYEKDEQLTMSVPLYQTTAFEFKSTEHGANLFALKELGNIYTRLSNPTTDVFERRFAEVEGGAAALATASGMAAIFYAIANCTKVGDNIVATDKLYGGTYNQFVHTLKRFGVEVRFFDTFNVQEAEKLIDENTKAIFFESISNPSIDIPDIETIVNIAKKHNVLSIVDNTVATPYLFRPFEWGIDISVHSTSKYVTGQGLAMGGIIVERKGLNEFLKGNDRYSHFNEPDMSYHGLVYTDLEFPAFCLRARLGLMRDLGSVPAPFNSWLMIQGLETLKVRIKEHCENTMKIAKFLKAHPKVKVVKYPLLEGDNNYANAVKYLKGGASGLLSFDVGSFDIAKSAIDRLKIFSLVTNIGDTKSIVTHSASTTHQQLSDEDLLACGVTPGLIRLSVGIEDVDDLINDLDNALK